VSLGRDVVRLIPREHGAYAELLVPLLTALVLAHARPAAWLLAGSAVFLFLLHEPVVLLAGHRGERRAQELSASARWAVFGLGLGALVLLGAGVWLSSVEVWRWLCAPLVLGAGAGLVLMARHEHTASGELLAAYALSSWCLPVMATLPRPWSEVLWTGLCFAGIFTASTLAVRATIAASKRGGQGSPWVRAGVGVGGLAVILLGLALALRVPALAMAAPAPPFIVSLAVCVVGPHPRNLRRIGWSFAAASLLTALLIGSALFFS
jgi:hypothetical protein